MAIHLRRFCNVLAVTMILMVIVLFFEWMIINAVLGCYTPDMVIGKENKSCVTFSQLFGY